MKKRDLKWWVIIGVLVLLGIGMMVAYSELETELQAERAKIENLAQGAEGLSQALEQAQVRVKALDGSRRVSEQEKGTLQAVDARLRTELQAERAKTKILDQRAQRLSEQMKQALAQMNAVRAKLRESERAKRRLRAKATRLETALRGSETAISSEKAKTRAKSRQASTRASKIVKLKSKLRAEQAKNKELTLKAKGLSKAMEQAEARVKALKESTRARKVAKLETEHQAEQAKTEKLTRDMAAMLELVTRFRADLVVLHHALGVSYNKLGINEKALQEFQAALEINPDHAESHFDLGRVYIEYLDDSASAAPHFRKYVRLRPEAREAEPIKGWLIKVEKEHEMKSVRERRRKGIFHTLY